MKLRNNKYLSKILELIKNKITDIIPHIMEIKREYIIFLCHKNFRRKKRNKWKVNVLEKFNKMIILIVLKFYQKIEKSDYFY